jgi:medium-chain acyl-[acyl-carrier-protein] hydrolase
MSISIWQEEAVVKPSDIDFRQQMKLSSYFLMMQDAASNHAEHIGYGYYDMLAKQMAWIMSRIKIRILRFPKMNEKLTVQTWPKGVRQKLFFMRDHRLLGADGEPVALATTAYVLVGAQARRILPPSALDVIEPDNEGRHALDEDLEKIVPAESLNECFALRAGYSATDIMRHVNNARYIEWISDCFSMEEHAAWQAQWLQINFSSEVKPGESVQMLRGARAERPGLWYVCGVNQTNGQRAFEAEIKFAENGS